MTLDADDPNWSELLSHPAETDHEGGEIIREAMPLERHLLAVARRAREATPAHAETADGESLRDAAEIVGLVHDFGKATKWFQTHIDNGTDDSGPSHHARLGGLLAYYALRQRGYGLRVRFAGLVAVAKHHGSLPDYDRFAGNAIAQQSTWRQAEARGAASSAYNGAAARQAAHIDEKRPAFADAVVERLSIENGSWTDFCTRLTASNDAIKADKADGFVEATLYEWLREDFFRGKRRPRVDGTLFDDGRAYLDELRLYGALTFADKTHAAGVRSDDDRLHADPLTTAQLDEHIADLGDDAPAATLEARLNRLRGSIQDHIRGQSTNDDPIAAFLDAKSQVATLTLPTGYGKTLTGLLAAARIREATDGDRIIYALPFTSVIDQTADVLREVLSDESDADPAMGRQLTVHHHLSESLILSDDEEKESEGTDADADRAVMLAESWRAGVTLTTFVQLFESLAGPRNSQSMKLPALYESVVIIDEPQALPLTWWPLVERLIEALVAEYDATVVLMTATQPRIVGEDDTFSLLDGETLGALEPEGDNALPDRVEYGFHPTALATGTEDGLLDYDDAAATLAVAATGTADATLAVCNTVDSTSELFDSVTEALGMDTDSEAAVTANGPVDIAARFKREIIDDERFGVPSSTDDTEQVQDAFVRSIVFRADSNAPAVLYLSTRLRPCDRRFLLAVASELTAAEIPLLVVSTQLVEAGVDVSFDRVFRDFAPLDSIVQAAGRCNRSFERAPDTGGVTVWRLGPPEDSTTIPGEAVYARREGDTDLDLLAKTREALTDVPTDETVSEEVVESAVDTYHDIVGDAVGTVSADNALRRHFERADGAALRRESLIDTRFTFEVYVCRSQADHMMVDMYRRAEKSYNFDGTSRLKKQLAAIRVSVPAYRPDSDTAAKLVRLDPLSWDGEKRTATERVWEADAGFESYFDTRTGIDIPESIVDTLIL
ncbi:CRISPR-associated endonuclease Cas3'' [Halococcus sp. AFM35]|uniref:CRISPR-associated endonuclease Cas3'' n=1 Tax=Halococcus sp. AFM35 TaxID=3421653 RepID=UPI003EBA8028